MGSQFLALATGILMMALLGMFNVHRHGAINAAAIVLYAFTSCKYLSLKLLTGKKTEQQDSDMACFCQRSLDLLPVYPL